MIKQYEEGLAELTRNRDSIAETQAILQARTEKQTQLRQSLANQRENQQQILRQIDAQVKTEEERLAALSANRDRLNTLLIELNELATRAPAPRQPFETSRGRLQMPVAGEIMNRFGSRRNTDMVWRGWLINASVGSPVRAIHPGQVIFSDWLRGQGLLVVIDHGEGWLSLYARNHSRFAGWVNRSARPTLSPEQETAAVASNQGSTSRSGNKVSPLIRQIGYSDERGEDNRVPLRPLIHKVFAMRSRFCSLTLFLLTMTCLSAAAEDEPSDDITNPHTGQPATHSHRRSRADTHHCHSKSCDVCRCV